MCQSSEAELQATNRRIRVGVHDLFTDFESMKTDLQLRRIFWNTLCDTTTS